jgi:hypothetical protein
LLDLEEARTKEDSKQEPQLLQDFQVSKHLRSVPATPPQRHDRAYPLVLDAARMPMEVILDPPLRPPWNSPSPHC